MADVPPINVKPNGSPFLPRIMEVLRRAMPELREKYGVKALGVWGSYVHGDPCADSDLDVLVEFDRTISLLDFVDLENRVSELVSLKVDLVMRSALKPNIGRRILREVLPV